MQTCTPIIDIHCHTAGIGAGGSGCFVSPALRRNIRYRFFLKAFGVSEAELEQHGDGLVLERLSLGLDQSRHVTAAVVLAMDGVMDGQGNLDRDRTEIYIPIVAMRWNGSIRWRRQARCCSSGSPPSRALIRPMPALRRFIDDCRS
jgi:hypothetical protein